MYVSQNSSYNITVLITRTKTCSSTKIVAHQDINDVLAQLHFFVMNEVRTCAREIELCKLIARKF